MPEMDDFEATRAIRNGDAGLDKDGLPLGLQIIGRAFDEETMLRAAAALEKAASFNLRPAGY